MKWGRFWRAAKRRPLQEDWAEIPPPSLLPKRTVAWFSRVNLPSPSGLSNSVAKRPILPQAKLPQLLNEPGRARRARRRSSLVSSSRAVAHSCRCDQPARIQRIPVRRCRRPACAVADASETMPPKNPVPRLPLKQPLRLLRRHLPLHRGGFGERPLPPLTGHRRGLAGPFSLETVHWTVSRALEPPYTGEPERAAQRRPYGRQRGTSSACFAGT